MIDITYFVHGTTTDNEQDRATGWLPGKLSTLGQEQSKTLAGMVAGQHFDLVFCSDLQRAVDTAQLAFGNKYKVMQDERLREANYGDMNGGPHSFKDTAADYIDQPFPSGESYKDVEKRVHAFCDFLRKYYDGRHVAIVAHQAPQLALDVLLNGKSWDRAIDEDWRKTKAWQPGWHYIIP